MSYKIQARVEFQLYTNTNFPVKAAVADLRHQGYHTRDKKEKIRRTVFTVGSFRCRPIFRVTF